jgi:hypothetical protein
MKTISNLGQDRVIDTLKAALDAGTRLDVLTPAFSLAAFAELHPGLMRVDSARMITSQVGPDTLSLFGPEADRPFRNRLQLHYHARLCLDWISRKAECKAPPNPIQQAYVLVDHANPDLRLGLMGDCALTREGLGLSPSLSFGAMRNRTESMAEWESARAQFQAWWDSLPASTNVKPAWIELLDAVARHKAPELAYQLVLQSLFRNAEDEVNEEQLVSSAVGIRDSVVWKKLFPFQRDGVLGALDKLEKFGGCILADSVGLGKTFEALAVIKHFNLRDKRVLVLAPKRLRDNWTLYAQGGDARNLLAADRLQYTVLNHTDLSRDNGKSGEVDLAHVNWGSYDLVVIDESHNFRNKPTHNRADSRYQRLMDQVIKAGVKTKVLMLSATPVNNRLNDLKNQIAFATEGRDDAFAAHQIPSLEATIRKAQTQFNAWLKLPADQKKPTVLLDMLGFDYVRLLDLLTIARSRKHIEKYYGTKETGKFPTRNTPINIKSGLDVDRAFPSIQVLNDEIRKLNLSVYNPLEYVLPERRAFYEERYGTKLKNGTVFLQGDREKSMLALMRVNMLKRLESSLNSFALTLRGVLDTVERLLAQLDAGEDISEAEPAGLEEDGDTLAELLLGGKTVKIQARDADKVKWCQALQEDRTLLLALLERVGGLDATRDAKLERLKQVLQHKMAQPINPGNRKVLVFTHYADTASYLYTELAEWAKAELGLECALVTGSGHKSIRTTLPDLRLDFGSVLSAFSPRSKERAAHLAGEGEIDLLIATDCISEGQNLQDCDFLVNYDIHWNPVRIIQRFGRVDRIGSRNGRIQLVNFWPDMELEEYINLERRVSGRMVLLDISATGEENLLREDSADVMNDLDYRRKQLEAMQNTVPDLEDLNTGLSITDLTLTDFRLDLARFREAQAERLKSPSPGTFAVIVPPEAVAGEVPPGILFCLKAATDRARRHIEPGYALAPYFLVHVADNGEIIHPCTLFQKSLGLFKRLAAAGAMVDEPAAARFDRKTKDGADMSHPQELLATAVASITGKGKERAAASLFSPGGTTARKGEFPGMDDFDVVAYLVVLPPENGTANGR